MPTKFVQFRSKKWLNAINCSDVEQLFQPKKAPKWGFFDSTCFSKTALPLMVFYKYRTTSALGKRDLGT